MSGGISYGKRSPRAHRGVRGPWRGLAMLSLVCGLLWSSTGFAALEPEDVERQIAELGSRIERHPSDPSLYIARGDARFLLHQFDEASDDYSRAIALDDSADQAYFGRGMALARAGFVEDGIRDLTVFLQRHPDSSRGYTKRGVRYLWLGDRANAEQDLRKAVALDAQNAEAHDDLGVVLAQSKAYQDAVVHFQTAIRIDPSYQKAHHNLAMVYYLTGQDLLALQAVDSSLHLSPEARNSLLLKATILDALGRTRQAAAIREQAEFLPEGNWSERADVQ